MSQELIGFHIGIYEGEDRNGAKVWRAGLEAPPFAPVFGETRYSWAEADADTKTMWARVKAELAAKGAPLISPTTDKVQ